jgi:surface antigen
VRIKRPQVNESLTPTSAGQVQRSPSNPAPGLLFNLRPSNLEALPQTRPDAALEARDRKARDNPPRGSSQGWQKSFSASSDGVRLNLALNRDPEGALRGALRVDNKQTLNVEGMLLEDGDVYLSASNGARLHGRFTGDLALLFGRIDLPSSESQSARLLRDVAFTERQPDDEPAGNDSRANWEDRVFNATVNGHRLMVKLDRDGVKLRSSEFYLKDVGAGVVVGELEAGTYRVKSLVFTFTSAASSSVKVGEKRELVDGYFKFVNGGLDIDQNRDGKHDQTLEDLPLELFGQWRNPETGKTWNLGRWRDETLDEQKRLEQAVIDALPEIMLREGKRIEQRNAEANIPLILSECRRAKITDPRQTAYILVTAGWESFLGGDMDENSPSGVDPVTHFNRKYANRLGNGDIASGDGYRYRGRGFVQLTGKTNYQRATSKARALDFQVDGEHPDLVDNPGLAKTNRPLAALILVWGMQEGWFTGVGLNTFTKGHPQENLYPNGKLDFDEARWIVNGKDENSKKPMASAAESLSSSMGQARQDGGDLDVLSQADYRAVRALDRDGFDPQELKRVKAGIETGSLDGVPGYYNGSTESETWGSHFSVDGYYYGEKWQCVEYVRRYYRDALKHDILKKGNAETWFTSGLEDGATTFDSLIQYAYAGRGTRREDDDGFSVQPKKGDILVLQTGTYGHVAIVSEASDTMVKIAQQNVHDDGFVSEVAMKETATGKWRFSERQPMALLRKP